MSVIRLKLNRVEYKDYALGLTDQIKRATELLGGPRTAGAGLAFE